jgi:Protein of unknown function (DUF1552)
MNRLRFDRRAFLRGLGVSSAFLPLLSSGTARGAPVKPKRFLVTAVPNGVKEEVYWPTGTTTSFKIPTDAEVPAAHKYSPLAPLIPHQKDIIFVGGIDLQNGWDSNGGSLGGHASLPFLLTGARGVPGPEISDAVKQSASVPSIDRFIGMELAKRNALRYDSLVLKAIARFRGNDGYLSFDGPPIGDAPNAPTQRISPIQLFDDLFGSAVLDAGALTKLRARRKSVLDLVGKHLEGFTSNLGSEDRQRVGAHLDAIRSVEKRLADTTTSCVKPVLGLDPTLDYVSLNGNPNTPITMKAQMDLVVVAMACDMTRVASLLWPDSVGNFTVFYWLGQEFTVPGTDFANAGENQGLRNHHEIAHRDSDPAYQPLANRVQQWYLEQFAYLIQKLKDTKDADGTAMFDSSVLLYANTQRTGGGHQTNNLPWILAGSAGGYFKTGQFLPWPSGTPNKGMPQNGILTAICNAMDVPRDWYGSADYGGEL